ncbi:DUF1552 domain-containing protein [Verrucomicrobiales bacterium]|nr:DUF1552 domain-containing protein [Verrucomicrobiales bacterium]MDB4721294.1 DUF1552 domain-containing protein [Verrucomicrobiales bacterium]
MKKKLNRRALLKGLGSVSIGLPLLEEMITVDALGASDAKIPVRAFNVFFGLGIPSPLQSEGFNDVLEPLKPLSDKLLIMRNVDHVRCDVRGINAHFDGATASFTAEPAGGEAKAGGPSIDQVIRHSSYPNGMPNGMISSLVAGTFFRRSRVGRYHHSYNLDGTVSARMQEKPRDLFDRVFGSLSDQENNSKRLKRSVLDSVLEQYRFFTGSNSPLGASSKGRIKDHLDRVREFEQRAFSLAKKNEQGPKAPPPSRLPHGGPADPGGEGIDITLDELRTEWRLLADLYTLAIEMDRARFGSITFLAAGERIRLTGEYKYNDRVRYNFNDSTEHGRGGSGGCSHEWWHKFDEKRDNKQLRAHAHMKMNELAYFMNRLDRVKEPNGKSLLENSLLTISTESGDGRHNNVKRELSGVFHAVTGANGRFKTGQIMDVKAQGIDLYNTMLGAMGADPQLGPKDYDHSSIDKILV